MKTLMGEKAGKAVGRTKGGLNTKIYAIVDGRKSDCLFAVTWEHHDSTHAIERMCATDITGYNLLGDKAYGTKGILQKKKWLRKVAIRYNKLDKSFLAFMYKKSVY